MASFGPFLKLSSSQPRFCLHAASLPDWPWASPIQAVLGWVTSTSCSTCMHTVICLPISPFLIPSILTGQGVRFLFEVNLFASAPLLWAPVLHRRLQGLILPLSWLSHSALLPPPTKESTLFGKNTHHFFKNKIQNKYFFVWASFLCFLALCLSLSLSLSLSFCVSPLPSPSFSFSPYHCFPYWNILSWKVIKSHSCL